MLMKLKIKRKSKKAANGKNAYALCLAFMMVTMTGSAFGNISTVSEQQTITEAVIN